MVLLLIVPRLNGLACHLVLLLAVVSQVGCGLFEPPPVDAWGVAQPVAAVPPGYATMPGFPPIGDVPAFPEATPAMAAPLPGPVLFAPTGPGDPAPVLSQQMGLPAQPAADAVLANPLKVPVNNHDYAWDQIADVVSQYFPIQIEQPVRIEPDLWTEGRIETPYQMAATALEPWRNDSVGQFNRWQSTLQTIRRRAVVRVAPEPDGYAVEVQVVRELEDLPRPEASTAGVASFYHDNSLPAVGEAIVSRTEASPFWIPLGRDAPLEQQMLAEIQQRLVQAPRIPMTITPQQ